MDIIDTTPHEFPVRAVLIGGPANLPDHQRIRAVSRESDKIKVAHYGGYEHFERAADRGADPAGSWSGEEVPFYWTMRTTAAE